MSKDDQGSMGACLELYWSYCGATLGTHWEHCGNSKRMDRGWIEDERAVGGGVSFG